MERKELKLVLLQIREDATVRREEWESFARHAGLEKGQILIHNVFDKPNFDQSILDGAHALFIGGASEASVLDKESPFLEPMYDLIRWCVAESFPVFASCFGFQAAVIAFGGEIVKDATDFEMGTLPISLAPGAADDPVYRGISDGFVAVSVHQEKCTELPEGMELLARTEPCLHSFRVSGKPFWTFQFHPELDKPCLTERLGVYKEKYTEDADHFQGVIDSLVDTPEANRLVRNFIDNVLL